MLADMKIFIFLMTVFYSFSAYACSTLGANNSIQDNMGVIDTYTWRVSDGWSNGGVFASAWRADHVDIYANTLRLTLDDLPCVGNATLCSGAAYAGGEYSSASLLPAGEVSFDAKVAKASGVITGLFLYTGASDGQPHDEIDIEFLGKNTTQVQFNYFVSGVGGHEVLLPLGFDASQAMHRYTIRWDATHIEWLVDGVQKHQVSGVVLPSSPMHIYSNIWAATGVDAWSGAFVYANPLYSYVDTITYNPLYAGITSACEQPQVGCFTPLSTWVWLGSLGFITLLIRGIHSSG